MVRLYIKKKIILERELKISKFNNNKLKSIKLLINDYINHSYILDKILTYLLINIYKKLNIPNDELEISYEFNNTNKLISGCNSELLSISNKDKLLTDFNIDTNSYITKFFRNIRYNRKSNLKLYIYYEIELTMYENVLNNFI